MLTDVKSAELKKILDANAKLLKLKLIEMFALDDSDLEIAYKYTYLNKDCKFSNIFTDIQYAVKINDNFFSIDKDFYKNVREFLDKIFV